MSNVTGPAEGGSAGGEPQTERLPDDTRLGPVRLQIANLDRSLAYYQEVLGLVPLQRAVGQATLAPPDTDTVLVELHEQKNAALAPQRGRLGLYHYAILLPERAALGRFAGHLAARGERPGASDHLVSEALYLRDPDGLGIEVYADRPRSSWRYRDGELAMASNPLDFEDLVRAAGDEPWRGMPQGAVVGHIHLHVGDLNRAAAFYQLALGFEKTVWSYPGALFLSAGGYHHHIAVNTWAGAGARPPAEDEARLLAWELVLPRAEDVVVVARRLLQCGYKTRDEGAGLMTVDPWGTPLRLAGASGA
jgi:catechol 2,3-dioxygenase